MGGDGGVGLVPREGDAATLHVGEGQVTGLDAALDVDIDRPVAVDIGILGKDTVDAGARTEVDAGGAAGLWYGADERRGVGAAKREGSFQGGEGCAVA